MTRKVHCGKELKDFSSFGAAGWPFGIFFNTIEAPSPNEREHGCPCFLSESSRLSKRLPLPHLNRAGNGVGYIMDIALIVILILINGIFAMSEMSVVSSARARLQKLADERRAGARTALKLHADPSRFLSTIQIGITSVGILSGALGEEALVEPLIVQLRQFPYFEPYAESLALAITVLSITYVSVVVGELVPKRLALLRPEGIARMIARPMNGLALIASPLVWLLSASSNLLLRLMGAHKPPQATVTNEEIKILMDMGSEAGVFHAKEGQWVSNVLKLDEQRVGAVMTPRKDIFFIDLNDGEQEVRRLVGECPYSKAVVCRGGLENVLGVLQLRECLKVLMENSELSIEPLLRSPLYVPDLLTLPHLLEFFKEKRSDFVLIVNEYGELEGLVTLSDVLKAIVGDLPSLETDLDPDIVQRNDGSWLVSGSLSINRMKSAIGMNGHFPGEKAVGFNTVGGFILFYLERIPRVADSFVYDGWYFEVIDVDGTRIDKVLVAKEEAAPLNK
ncbi:hemolysin family protein [Methylosarcina fibrata]|uniref:hemolysin family protein n=1 Tax=Methylosarcina fibrata TaxID=105972 RepID=UPI001E600AAB|nr:hemolysin family protein [Methylosarcina fibrata]